MDQIDLAASELNEEGMPTDNGDMEYLEHWTIGDYDNGVDKDVHIPELDPIKWGWNPYEQDLSLYPELYKIYGENMDWFERAKRKFETEKLGDNPPEGNSFYRTPKNMDPWTKKYDDFMPRYTGSSML
jgi:hypothetical protein